MYMYMYVPFHMSVPAMYAKIMCTLYIHVAYFGLFDQMCITVVFRSDDKCTCTHLDTTVLLFIVSVVVVGSKVIPLHFPHLSLS